MNKILILFAHPAFHKSRINNKMIRAVQDLDEVTINNLYDKYPDFFIDVKREQKLLVEHDIVVWHHPFYWYSAPAIIKEWMDLVLEHGFAYGKEGIALRGKKAISVISTGGKKEVYCEQGRNHYTINQFLVPFHQSANLCGMDYLPPFVVHGSHTISEADMTALAEKYRRMLVQLRSGSLFKKDMSKAEYINHILN